MQVAEIAPIHRWAGIIFAAAYLIIFIIRLVRGSVAFTYHFGPAFISAGGATAIIESGYLLYRGMVYGSLVGVEGLWLYAIAGALAALSAGVAGLIQGLKE